MFQEPVDRTDVMAVKPDVPFVLREVAIRNPDIPDDYLLR